MKKQSILLINRVYPPEFGATGQMTYDLVQHLVRQGHTVSVLTTGDGPKVEAQPNVTIYRMKTIRNSRKPFGFIWAWLKFLFATLKMKHHDVVITLTDPPMLVRIGGIYSALRKAKHIHWCHDLYPDLLPELGIKFPHWLQSSLNKSSRQSMKSSDTVVTISKCMARHLSMTGVPTEHLNIIPNWSPTEVLKNNQTSQKRISNTQPAERVIRDDNPKFRVLYAGHIGRAHVINPLLDAAEKLQQCAEIEFTFVCQKYIHEKISLERNKRGLENIKLVPLQPMENIASIIESGDVHIVTMRNNVEGMLLPSKFYASLAVGRPVIFVGPTKNDISDMIKKYNMGAVISPNDPEALAQAIYDLRMDGDRWFQAQQGVLEAATVFNAAESMKKWDQVIQKVA